MDAGKVGFAKGYATAMAQLNLMGASSERFHFFKASERLFAFIYNFNDDVKDSILKFMDIYDKEIATKISKQGESE